MRVRRRDDHVRAQQRTHQRDHYDRRRKLLLEFKEGQMCAHCGFDDPRALTFHHREPQNKSFNIASHHWKYSWERVLEEIGKCDLLCANCHAIEHFSRRQEVWI